MSARNDSPLARLREGLLTRWFRPRSSWASALLMPLSWLYAALQRHARKAHERRAALTPQPDCPVVVVGNLIVGGAGKTPTTLAVLQALRGAGCTPGVVSRGHGGRRAGVTTVSTASSPHEVGDEPLLIHRRGGVPVVVGRDRVAAARQLLLVHPCVDVIVSDDGLQHRQLRRDLEVLVFDERGIGNGHLLPAGPLREAFTPTPPPQALVLYNHDKPSTPWPGACASRRLTGVWPLARWLHDAGPPASLASLQGRRLLAVAGIAVPERFFSALEGAGLSITRLALPDHHDYATLPWPSDTREVVTTEKDAVKLAPLAATGLMVWVVGLDLVLPAPFVADLLARVAAARRAANPTAPKGRP